VKVWLHFIREVANGECGLGKHITSLCIKHLHQK
jgi:hypothetical protein